MWQLVQANGENADYNCVSPTARTKHATCANYDGYIYLYGGKSGNMSLKDLWRFDTENDYWEEIKCSGDHPPSLQEHTMISWNNKLYIFGGEIGYSSQDTPLWQLDINTWQWFKFGSVNLNSPGISSTQPTGRSGHTSVLYENTMYIYGGFQELSGSLTELWSFDLCTEQWSLVTGPCITTVQPPARHSHSAAVHDNEMYIYGGMNNLEPKSDFWKWNFHTKTWTKIKSNRGPGELHGHSAVKAFNCMFIFGGERDGSYLKDLWRFNFDTESWNKLHTSGMLPSPRSMHTAVSNLFIEMQKNWDVSSSISSNNSNQSNLNSSLSSSSNSSEKNESFDKFSSKPDNLNKKDKKIVKKNSFKDQAKNDKNKENKCNCLKSNEGSIKNFFRIKISKNKLVRSSSTNSYNTSHNENCNFFCDNLTSSNNCERKINKINTIKKSNTCCEEPMNRKNIKDSNCLISSNTIENFKTKINCKDIIDEKTLNEKESFIQDKKSNNIYNKNMKLNPEVRKYDIGNSQLSCLGSPEAEIEDLDIFNKINQLQEELNSQTFKNNIELSNKKKPRPKSELIAELANLDEDINDSWDGIDLKRHSVHESMSYYSLCFPSPHYSPQTITNNSTNFQTDCANNFSLKSSSYTNNFYPAVKIRNRSAVLRKARPKTYHQHSTYYDTKENRLLKSFLNSELNEINEIPNMNDDLFLEEEMVFTDTNVNNDKNKLINKEIYNESSSKINEELNKRFNQVSNKNSNKNNETFKDLDRVDENCFKESCIIEENNKNFKLENKSNINKSSPTNNTTVCSPVSTNSALGCSISKSLSQSSGYQSFMEDSLVENSNSTNLNSNYANSLLNEDTITENSISSINNNSMIEENSSILRLNSNTENNYENKEIIEKNKKIINESQSNKMLKKNILSPNKRYSCNITSFNEFSTNNEKINDNQNLKNKNSSNQETKKIPNSSSNLEIGETSKNLSMNSQFPRVESWEKKLMVKTFSTNNFISKETYSNQTVSKKNQINHYIGFNSLSRKVNSLDFNFLMKSKKKDKKKKNEYKLCMLIFGGNEKTNVILSKQPISVYKLFV